MLRKDIQRTEVLRVLWEEHLLGNHREACGTRFLDIASPTVGPHLLCHPVSLGSALYPNRVSLDRYVLSLLQFSPSVFLVFPHVNLFQQLIPECLI